MIINHNDKTGIHTVGFDNETIAYFIELLKESEKELLSENLIAATRYLKAIFESAYLGVPLHLLGI